MGTLSALAVALSFVAARGDASSPSFAAQANHVAAIALPASILGERDVQQQIASGLTTTFVLIAHQRGSDLRGGAKLEIRFDLWDEVWLVRRIEFDGKESHERIASHQSLEKWWTTPLRLIAAGAQRASLTVVMSVLPFSGAEESDARDWVAKSASGGPAEARSSPFVTALIGTTLSAKPIRTYRWSGDVNFP